MDDATFKQAIINKAYLKLSTKTKWIKINHGYSIYYRTDYESEIMSDFKKILHKDIKVYSDLKQTFSVSDRMSLISDAFTMVSLGKRPVYYALDLYEILRKEEDFYVMSVFFDQMKYLKMLFYKDRDILYLIYVKYILLQQYVLGFTQPIIDKYGIEHIVEDDYISYTFILIKTIAITCNFYEHIFWRRKNYKKSQKYVYRFSE